MTGRALVAQADALRLPLPDECVDLVVTSPPFWNLRDYGVPGQLGNEPTRQEFLEHLWAVTAECMRVMKPTASLFVELGDSYATRYSSQRGAGRAGLNGDDDSRGRSGQNRTGSPEKSLNLTPQRYAIGCVDQLGLTLRAEIIWSHVNGLPESVRDRVRMAHSRIYHFTKQPRYYSAIDELRSQSAQPRLSGASAVGRPVIGGSAVNAAARRAALGPKVRATVHTDDGALDGWGQCDFGQSQISIVLPVAVDAQCLQVVEPVGLQVIAEVPERDLVVDLQVIPSGLPVGASTGDAAVSVSFKRCLASLGPVGAAVASATPSPTGVVLAAERSAPSPVALRGAKATDLELALDPGHGVAARITLASDQGEATLLVWDSLATASRFHRDSLRGRSDSLGKLPGSVWAIPSEPLRLPDWLGVQHYAAFPSELPRRIILGWSPPGVCCACGEGRWPVVDRQQRITQQSRTATYKAPENGRSEYFNDRTAVEATILGYACRCTPFTDHPGAGERIPKRDWTPGPGQNPHSAPPSHQPGAYQPVGSWREYHLTGWHSPPTRPAVVLDCFGGVGTTALVARALGRHAYSFDLSFPYSRAAQWRIHHSGHHDKAIGRTNLERQQVLL